MVETNSSSVQGERDRPQIRQVLRELYALAPQLRVAPLGLCIPLSMTVAAAACDAAVYSLLAPLLLLAIAKDGHSLQQLGETHRFFGLLLDVGIVPTVGQLAVLVLFLSIVASPLRRTAAMLIELAAKAKSAELQTVLFEHIVSYGKLYFMNENVAALHDSRAQAGRLYSSGLRQGYRILEALVFIAFYLAVLLSISWVMSLYFLIAAFFALLVSRSFQRTVSELAEVELLESRRLWQGITAALQGIEIIKANALEAAWVQRIRTQAAVRHRAVLAVARKAFYAAIVHDLLAIAFILLLVGGYWYFAPLSGAAASAEVGALIGVFLVLARRLLQPLAAISHAFEELAKVSPAVGALAELLSPQDKHRVVDGVARIGDGPLAIVCKDLTFSYPGATAAALVSLSCEIPAGKTTAIVGRSGAGKTTFLNVLLRSFVLPEKSVFADGVDLTQINQKHWGEQLAFISQNQTLFAGTLRENLTASVNRFCSDEELYAVLERVLLEPLLQRLPLGLETVIGEQGLRFSKGEQQRISIARAMLQDPQLVLVDEGSAALDVQTEIELMETLRDFCQGRTTVMVAHRLATIVEADQILVLEQGRLVEHGSFSELLETNGVFAALWATHQRVARA